MTGTPRCPFCDAAQTERVGQWGGQIITAQWVCRGCGSHFEAIREARRTVEEGKRELEVLVLVARGLSNAQIARSLGLSETGVKSRVNRILTRLGLENRVQAAILAYESGLVGGSHDGNRRGK